MSTSANENLLKYPSCANTKGEIAEYLCSDDFTIDHIEPDSGED